MILVVVLIALSAWSVVATVVEVRRDGYRPVPTDWSRVAGVEPANAAFPAAPRHEQPLTDVSLTDESLTDESPIDASPIDATTTDVSPTDVSLTERQQTDYARQHERAAAAPHPLAGAVADGA